MEFLRFISIPIGLVSSYFLVEAANVAQNGYCFGVKFIYDNANGCGLKSFEAHIILELKFVQTCRKVHLVFSLSLLIMEELSAYTLIINAPIL